MLVIADSATPIVLVEERTNARASVFGAKPTSAIAASTARTVSGDTFRVLLRTCDTVVTDTPARFATSIIFATIGLLSVSREVFGNKRRQTPSGAVLGRRSSMGAWS